jgi:type IV pilus assembly protein PilO
MHWCVRAQWSLAAIALALAGVFYFLHYRPQNQRQQSLASQIALKQRELQEGRTHTSVLPEVATEVERLRARVERSKKSIPRQQDLPQFIRDVSQLGQQASLRKPAFKPGTPARADLVSELPIQMTFEGDFVNVYSFLRNLEEMPRLTRVRDMKLVGKDRAGQVKVTISMNIYFSPDQ